MDQDRWDRLAQVPLLVAALVYLVAYSVQVLVPVPPPVAAALAVVVGVVWVMFLVDYLARLALAKHRAHWFVRHLFDLVTVALPFLRPLHLLQLLRSATILTSSRALRFRAGALAYAIGGAVFVVYVGSLAEYSVERNAPGADITSFGDAVWWSITTVTTVGYGDYAPVTVAGRVIATGIMVVGIALLGTVTAAVASYVAQQTTQPAPDDRQDPRGEAAQPAEGAPVRRASTSSTATTATTSSAATCSE